MSRCIWVVDEDIVERMMATTKPSAKQWLFTMKESMSHEAFVKLAVTLWVTWWARRKAIHEGDYQSPLSTNLYVNHFIAELEMRQEIFTHDR